MKKNGKAPLLKLDLGCGENKRDGFLGVDLFAPADFKVDLMKFPWAPFKDQSVEEVFCSHFFEHVPGPTRIPWMDELYRVLVPGGKATMITPYWSSPRAIQDPTHQWPPIAEQSFLYYNKNWRDQNKLNHYLGKCNFEFTFAYTVDVETAQRVQETQQFYIKHYLQSVHDLHVHLVKI
jgi:ubiquinone/menaquinone biosynthesis C-methylase UbiE